MILKDVTVEAATVLEVQLEAEGTTESAKPEDKIIARLIKPVIAEGVEVMPKDTPVTGTVMLVDKAGAIRGRPRIEWQFESLVVANTRISDDMIEIEVSDSGSGFQDDVIPNLFQTFFTTKETGMGVGLSISRSIIEAHGGRMVAESNASGGATFHFTLPAADET